MIIFSIETLKFYCSLLKIGGHNPFEAIQLNCVVISGAEVFNFAEIYQDLQQKNACEIVENVDKLYEIVQKFLQNPNEIKIYNINAQKAIFNSQNTVQKIIKKLDEILMLGI